MVKNQLFEDIVRELDNNIHRRIGPLSDYLPNPIDDMPLFQNFQEHLMYIIMSFLSEEDADEEPQELFIQIPVNKFSNITAYGGDEYQMLANQMTAGTIASCLFMSTIGNLINKVKLTESQIQEMAAWNKNNRDKIGTTIICEINGEPQLLTFKEWTRPRPRVGNNDALYTYHPERLGTFWGYKDNKKIKKIGRSVFLQVSNAYILKSSRQYIKDDIIDEARQISELARYKDSIPQYNSVAFVHVGRYEPINEKTLLKSRYFETVRLETDINNIKRSDNTEVIIAFGNKKYRDVQPFRRRATKKIIYIGSEPPSDDIPAYSFSFREMYRYCSMDGLRFEEPHMIRKIQFPWMDNTLSALKELLDVLSEEDDNLTEEIRHYILKLFRSRFSSIDFCYETWEDQKYDIDIDIECSSETLDSVKEWCENLVYDSQTNPKMEEIRNLPIPPTLVFGKYWRKHLEYDNNKNIYKLDRNVVNTYIKDFKTLSDIDNCIIIDCASYSRGQNDSPIYKAYKHLIKNHLYANVITLYYDCEDNYAQGLLWYLHKEFDCYNSPKRHLYDTDISKQSIIDNNDVIIPDVIFTLEDFMDSDDISDRWSYSESKQIFVSFKDNHQDRIDGDILVVETNGYRRDKIQNYEDEDFDSKDISIIYYKKNLDFERYMTAYYDLPQGEDIQFFEQMWKRALREYISSGNRQTLVENVSRRTGIASDKIKRYLNENCMNKFFESKREMEKICRLLSLEGFIPEDKIRWIIAAKRAHDKYKRNGVQLKREILSYKIDPGSNTPMIQKIVSVLNIPIDEMVNNCLDSGIISNIEIN